MPTPEVKVGQVWERLKDGVRVKIVAVDNRWNDITYRNLDTKTTNEIFLINFATRYRLIQEATDA